MLDRILARIKNEPAVVIGFIGVVVLGVLQSLAGNGIIGADVVATWSNLVGSAEMPGPIAVLFVAIVTRFFVSPPR